MALEYNPLSGEFDIVYKNFVDRDFVNGTFKESFNALDTSNGSVVTLTLTASDAAPLLTMQFSDGLTTIATPATIELTTGTDSNPQKNYIYILKSTKVLTKSTTGFPDEEHIPIVFILTPSATQVQSDGSYINQNWNDHLMNGNNQGHLSHIGAAIRLKTGYFSGFDPQGTDQDTNSSYMDYVSGSESYFKYSSGKSRQMHLQASPAFDTTDASDDIHVINWNGDSYHELSNLTDIQTDSTGGSLSNKYFNIFFFATVNKEGQYHPVMAKLPSGSYSTQTNTENDVSGFDDLTMPREFNIESTVGVPLCRMTFRYSGGLSSLTHISTKDLRRQGLFIAGGGGGGGVSDHGALTGLEDDDHSQYHNDSRAATWLAANHETTYTHSDIATNTTHRTSDGSDHSFIDQSVIFGATPTFTGTNITGVPASSVLAGTFGTGDFTVDGNLEVDGGLLTVGDGSGDADMIMDGAAGNNRAIEFQTGGSRRFGMGISNVAESGSNVGSDFFMNRFADNGSFLGSSLIIGRDDGLFTIGKQIKILGGTPGLNKVLTSDAVGKATWETPNAGRIEWEEVTGITQAGAVNTGYIANNANEVEITLPSTMALGDIIRIMGKGAGGWKAITNVGQAIHTITTSTARGAGFGIRSPAGLILGTDLLCTTANTDWTMLIREGNIIFTKFSEKSILFDGINEGLDIDSLLTNVLTTTTQGTFSAWVKPVDATPTGNEYIISFGDTDASENLQIRIDTNGKINASVRIAATNQWRVITTGAAFTNNTWGHVALVQNGTEPVIYINGVAVAQSFDVSVDKTKWFNDYSGLDNGRIGMISANNAGNNSFLHGNIDDVTFWDTNLTSGQILELYNSGIPIDPRDHSQAASLVAYYQMGDNDNDTNITIIDASTNSNNATGINLESGDIEEDTPPT